MKSLLKTIIASFLIFSPVYSQYEENEVEVPVEKLILKKDQIPPAIVQEVNKSFQNYKALQWYSFPYLIKEYGWAYKGQADANLGNTSPDQYAVHITTSEGSKVDAIYTKDGKLVRSREVIVNSTLPKPIVKAIETGPYKGWAIVGDRSIITVAKNNSVHYAVKIEKNNVKHTLYFDKNGNQLKNKA